MYQIFYRKTFSTNLLEAVYVLDKHLNDSESTVSDKELVNWLCVMLILASTVCIYFVLLISLLFKKCLTKTKNDIPKINGILAQALW